MNEYGRRGWWVRSGTIVWLGGIAVLGFVGWGELYPEITTDELLYRSFALIVLAWDVDYTVAPIPLALNVARYLALGFAFTAAATVVWRLLHHRHLMEQAKRAKDHTVIVGDGPEVVGLARRHRAEEPAARVVVIGQSAEERRVGLAGLGIVVPAATDGALTRILRGARRIVVTAPSDQEAARLATRVETCTDGKGVTPTALFDEPNLARQWNHGGTVTALSRATQIAIAALRSSPPVLEDAATPPPFVVGDGVLATEVARRMVTGWQQLGERMTVHCIGESEGWVHEARAGLEARAELTFTRSPRNPEAVARRVRSLNEKWERPRADRFDAVGPTVFVALPDPTLGFPIAARIAEALPDARVTAFVDDPTTWGRRLTGAEGRVLLVSASDLLSDPATLTLTPERLLAEELLKETGRWPKGVPSAFGDSPDADAVAAVAAAASDILAAGNIGTGGVYDDPPEGILSDPEELLAMRDALLRVLRTTNGPDQPLRTLELAGRLPTLVARAGWTPHRINGTTNMLTAEELHRLAQLVHLNYGQVAADTHNATGSDNARTPWEELSAFEQESNRAQAVDIPAKLAVLGLTWQRSDDPQVYVFDADQLERLAELEHRRWEHHQIRNGRAKHEWAVPWDELTDDVKEYDRNAVRTMPASLAELGVEIGLPNPSPADAKSAAPLSRDGA